MQYCFGDHVLDTQRAELQRAGAPIKLRRQAFQALVYLLAHRGRVVPKQELLAHLWLDQCVGDEVLKACIKAVRQALGEPGRTPRCVRTLHGYGYRFVAPVEVQEPLPVDGTAPPSCSPPSAGRSPVPPVGREQEVTRLHGWLPQARRGVRQMVFVTGEAGLGKTTLVDAFVAEIGTYGPLWIGHGQGNPLFMVTLVESWRTQRVLLEQDGVWALAAPIEALHHSVPDSLRQMIDRQLDGLSAEEQRVLEAASVAGMEFSAADVAVGLAQEVEVRG